MMHAEAKAWVAAMCKGQHYGRVLEFGSLDINGGVRDAIDTVRYYGIDLQDGPGVHEIADAAIFRSTSRVDLVVCCEVLEHSPNVEGILANAHANLRAGGVLLVTCATAPRAPHSAVDGGPIRVGEHYANVDPDDLAVTAELVGFYPQVVQVYPERGDLYMRAKKP